jgi:hypothetical protein
LVFQEIAAEKEVGIAGTGDKLTDVIPGSALRDAPEWLDYQFTVIASEAIHFSLGESWIASSRCSSQ